MEIYGKSDCRIWGAHAPSRAIFGALAENFFKSKVRDREGAIASTRGACAPQRSGKKK